MTEPVPEQAWDVNAEVDIRLAAILAEFGMGELDNARAYLRRLLLDAWYDGQSAAWNASRQVGPPRQNPWVRSTGTPDKRGRRAGGGRI
jgi:hypothetical protein